MTFHCISSRHRWANIIDLANSVLIANHSLQFNYQPTLPCHTQNVWIRFEDKLGFWPPKNICCLLIVTRVTSKVSSEDLISISWKIKNAWTSTWEAWFEWKEPTSFAGCIDLSKLLQCCPIKLRNLYQNETCLAPNISRVMNGGGRKKGSFQCNEKLSILIGHYDIRCFF